MKHNKVWAAEKLNMQRTFSFLTGRSTKIIDIPPGEGALAYTGRDGNIHIAYEHPVMEGLKPAEKITFRKGVFCHETGHQMFTDFHTTEKKMRKLPAHERRIFATIANVLEDPAIEFCLSQEIGGPLLKSLRFAIAHTYRVSPKLQDATTPFSQYIAALVDFGDMGLLKGRFTFPEAKKCFNETAAIFEKGILEPNPTKRLDYAEEIFNISRPLWEEDAEFEQMMRELAEMLAEMGKSPASGSGRGKEVEVTVEEDDSPKCRRRKITIKKISKEEMERMKEEGELSSGPLPETGDITICVCDKEEEDDNPENKDGTPVPVPTSIDQPDNDTNEEGEASGDSTSQDTSDETANEQESTGCNKQDDGSSEHESDANGESESTSDKSDGNSNASGKSENDAEAVEDSQESNSRDSKFSDKQTDNPSMKVTFDGSESSNEPDDHRIDEEEYTLSPEDIASILAEIERVQEVSDELNAEDDTAIPNYDISSTKMSRRSCLNYRVKINAGERDALERIYQTTLAKMSRGIHTTTTALRRIFQDDKEEKLYRTSGSISLKRCCSGTVTSRLFERRVAPADKSDLVVEILVDESGSMSGNNKYISARECCIALAEIFNNLKIPVYVMGFTADTQGYGIVHAHYVTWKNTKVDRLKLLNISARANNCDGASVRYATEVLKKKSAKNKLLIVLSDGMPAARDYGNGMSDTRDAVREAKKHASVLGVAIGQCDAESIQYLYEKDFLHIRNVEDLFAGIAKKMKSIIKHW